MSQMAAGGRQMTDWSQLLGATGENVAAERAIAEFRAGRPVIIAAQDGARLVAPTEGLDESALSALQAIAAGDLRLLASGPRLAHLGVAAREGAALPMHTLNLARIFEIALARAAKITETVAPLSQAEVAALHLTHLASLLPSAVSTPAPEAAFGLHQVSAEALFAYKSVKTADLHIVSRAAVPLDGAPDSEMVVFRGGEGLRDHAAVIVGAPDLTQPVDVRLHSACLTGDVFGSLKCDCGDQLRMTAQNMAQGEGGIILYLDQEGRANGLASKIKAYALQADGYDTYDADALLGFDHDQRGFDFAARMLTLLGVKRVRLWTNNPIKIAALQKAGVEVVAHERVHGRTTPQNVGYLEAKRDKAGHKFAAEIALAQVPAPARDA
jgi:GTP cyclohydrolase II